MTELEQADEQRSFEAKKREALLENFKMHSFEIHVAPRHKNNISKQLSESITGNRELHDLVFRLTREGQTFEELMIKALRYYEKNLSLAELD